MQRARQLMVWPVLAVIGFLALTALDIALGRRSTRRYEPAQEGVATSAGSESRAR